MFRKTSPLQSKSEILLRNITVTGMILFYTVFLLVPIGIAFAGSFHEWNPLSGIYRFNGIENYVSVFTSALFGKSMLNTLIFSVVVIFFRVGLGLAIAIAIYSNLIKHKSFSAQFITCRWLRRWWRWHLCGNSCIIRRLVRSIRSWDLISTG